MQDPTGSKPSLSDPFAACNEKYDIAKKAMECAKTRCLEESTASGVPSISGKEVVFYEFMLRRELYRLLSSSVLDDHESNVLSSIPVGFVPLRNVHAFVETFSAGQNKETYLLISVGAKHLLYTVNSYLSEMLLKGNLSPEDKVANKMLVCLHEFFTHGRLVSPQRPFQDTVDVGVGNAVSVMTLTITQLLILVFHEFGHIIAQGHAHNSDARSELMADQKAARLFKCYLRRSQPAKGYSLVEEIAIDVLFGYFLIKESMVTEEEAIARFLAFPSVNDHRTQRYPLAQERRDVFRQEIGLSPARRLGDAAWRFLATLASSVTPKCFLVRDGKTFTLPLHKRQDMLSHDPHEETSDD